MAERNFTDGDIKALGKEIASAIGKGNSNAPSAPSPGNVSVPKESLSAFDAAMKGAGKAVDATKDAYNKVSPSLEKGLDTWRDLSKVGAGFSNDIVGMTAAAAGTRMPLGEFAGVIAKNAENLSGFGGNVTRGAEEFSRLSKKMFDDYAPNTDQLRQMGLANKDLNELLMIQSVSTRAKMKDGDEKDKKLIENAMALGTEMDLMAKLTGKSREAQMEQQRKNQQDMAFEAAIRRKTIGMSADQAMEFEANARKQLADAQMRGQEAVFKDVFSTGTIKSKEAAAQASINQEQAAATMKQAQVSADKTMEAKERERQANAASLEGRRAFDKDMQNDTKLMYASMGEEGGAMGKAVRAGMSANIEYQRNFESTATKMFGENAKLTEDQKIQVQKRMDEEAKAAAAGKKGDGTQGDASTKALVNLGARAGEVESAFMNKIVKPLNEKVNPAFDKLAEGALGASKKGSTETRVNAAERELDEGAKGKTTTALNKVAGANEALGDTANKLAGVNNPPKALPKKALGGPVEEGEPYIVGDGGEEEIFVPKSAGEIIPKSMLSPKGLGSRSQNMESAYKSMQSMDPAKMFADVKDKTSGGGINFNEISKDISTTISGGGSSSIKLDASAIADMTKPFEKSFKDFNSGFKDVITTSSKEITSVPFAESFDEFGSNFDQVVAKMNNDVADAMGSSKAEAAQAKIDAAIAAKDAAYEKLQKLWNEGSDDELNENHEKYAEELRAAKENLNQVVAESMSDIASGFDDFGSGWDESLEKVSADITDAMPFDSINQTADALEFASKRRQELEDIMNDGMARSGAEWDEIFDEAEQLDGQIEKLTNKQLDAMSKYSDGWSDTSDVMDQVYSDINDAMPIDTEFGDLEGAMKAAQQRMYPDNEFGDLDKAINDQKSMNTGSDFDAFYDQGPAMKDAVAASSPTKLDRGITMDSFSLSPTGLPIAKPKSTAAAVPDKKKDERPAADIAEEKEKAAKAEREKAGPDAGKAIKKEGGEGKGATLDDLLKSMNALNTKVGQLIAVNEDGHKASAKAAKSNNGNLYAR